MSQSISRTTIFSLLGLPIASLLTIFAANAAEPIRIGQSTDLTGPISARLKAQHQAADAYFSYINRLGGVNNRPVQIVRLDDGYKVERTKENVKKLIEQDKVLALWSISGTPNVLGALPLATEARVPLIGSPSAGDELYSKHHPFFFAIRASYSDEIRAMISHLVRLNIKRIGAVHIAGIGAQESAMRAIEQGLAAHGLKPVAVAKLDSELKNVDEQITALSKEQPEAVITVTLVNSTPKVIEAYEKTGRRTQFYGLSVLDPGSLYKALGEKSRGLIVAQTVPYPWDRGTAVVKEYQDVMIAEGVKDFSIAGMDGFIQAKFLVSALRLSRNNLSREGLIVQLHRMSKYDLGGITFDFSPGNHNGTQFVELTMISKDGKIIR